MAEHGRLREALAAASMAALWERDDSELGAPEPPHIWRWSVIDPMLDQAVAATTTETAERRVLVLLNPAYAGTGRLGASRSHSVNFQVIVPGERARPHRHSMSALRFVIEGEGAITVVDGKPCAMRRGDMILTPGWTWHEHAHEGSGRAVWVDVLDVPLHRFFATTAFEPGPAHDVPDLPDDAAFAAPGFTPFPQPPPAPYSPMFRYGWDGAMRALAAAPSAADGARRLRYTDPVTGGPALPVIDCYLLAPAMGRETAPCRSTANAVCIVVEGEGVSRVGETVLEWRPNDVFTLPHGHWISHVAATADARLFLITDREILRRLDLLREEARG